jgi:hypothetical protein
VEKRRKHFLFGTEDEIEIDVSHINPDESTRQMKAFIDRRELQDTDITTRSAMENFLLRAWPTTATLRTLEVHS